MVRSFDLDSVRSQSVDFVQIENTFRKARQSLDSARKLEDTDSEGAFTMAYETMLKASLALMFSHGYRPRVQLGHHKTLVNFSAYVLGDRFASLTKTYDKMRSRRNKIIYDALTISKTETSEAIKLADKYLVVISAKIEEDNPQLKLC